MNHLSICPPETLKNIIGEDYSVWKSLVNVSKYFYFTCKSDLFSKEPLKRSFKEWYFLAYLKLNMRNFESDEIGITNEVINHIPKQLEKTIYIELLNLSTEGGYEHISEFINSYVKHHINPQKSTIVECSQMLAREMTMTQTCSDSWHQ